MRLYLMLLVLLLLPVVSADNMTANQTDATAPEMVYNPEVLVDQHGNFNRSSVLFKNFLTENFGEWTEIRLSYRGTNDTVWCQEKSVVRLADGYLYNLRYNAKTMDCEGDFKISGDADFSQVLAVDEIREALISEYEQRCDQSRGYDIERIDNLKLVNKLYIGSVVVMLIGALVSVLNSNLKLKASFET